MIPEPQRTYLLELLRALGAMAEDFVVAGAQAMKFIFQPARATKDFDFVLNVVALREQEESVRAILDKLGYEVVPEAKNFQFEKTIPNSKEIMRIEFLAPDELTKGNNFRVAVQKGVHAHACTGGAIALAESAFHDLSGNLPDGAAFSTKIRVTRAHALVLLKLLALDDRYRNIRGPAEARHDREEARVHAADIVAIASAQIDIQQFRKDFERQLLAEPALAVRVLRILDEYFRLDRSAGFLVYEEQMVGDKPLDRAVRDEVARELERAHRLMSAVLPEVAFYQLLSGVEQHCDREHHAREVGEYVAVLEAAGVSIASTEALRLLPEAIFASAIGRGDKFEVSTDAVVSRLTEPEQAIAHHHQKACAAPLVKDDEWKKRYRVHCSLCWVSFGNAGAVPLNRWRYSSSWQRGYLRGRTSTGTPSMSDYCSRESCLSAGCARAFRQDIQTQACQGGWGYRMSGRERN